MANIQDKIIVWEWHVADIDRYRPYEAFVSNFIEDYAKKYENDKTNHVIDLKSVDPMFFANHEVDLQNMVQTNRLTGNKRLVRRSVYSGTSTAARGIEWHWSNDQFEWEVYDIQVASIIERAFQKGKQDIDLQHTKCRFPYTIDFTQMMQIRNGTGYLRRIERVQVQTEKYRHLNCVPSNSRHATQSTSNPSAAYTISSSNTASAIFPANSANAISSSNTGTASAIFSTSSTHAISSRNTPRAIFSTSAANAMASGNTTMSQYLTNSIQLAMSNTANSTGSGYSAGRSLYVLNPMTGITMHSPFSSSMPPLFAPIASSKPFGSTRQTTLPMIGYNLVSNFDMYAKLDIGPAAGASEDSDHIRGLLKKISTGLGQPPDDECTICMLTLKEDSPYNTGDGTDTRMELNKCKHSFHQECLIQLVKNSDWKNNCLKCPTCKTIYGTATGVCPPGTMYYWSNLSDVLGYDGCGSIQIQYDIKPGIQTKRHPNPGAPFTAHNFPRSGYLPHTEKGRLVLQLLIVAWKRKLTFTIGTSVTTGRSNCVVWNEIHHKTSPTNNSAHGYPDAKYLDNVLAELENHGITPSDANDIVL